MVPFKKIGSWIQQGTPWIWLNAGAVCISLLMVFGLLGFIAFKGAVHFWPRNVITALYEVPGKPVVQVMGEKVDSEIISQSRLVESGVPVTAEKDFFTRYLIKIGNREINGLDFRWALEDYLTDVQMHEEVMIVERREWGNFYGYLQGLVEDGQTVKPETSLPLELDKRVVRANKLYEKINRIEKQAIGAINYQLEKLRLEKRELELKDELTASTQEQFSQETQNLDQRYEKLQQELQVLYRKIERDAMVMQTVQGKEQIIPLSKVVRFYQPNQMTVWDKSLFYLMKLKEFVIEEPREANTEGGIFPAIFGTVTMVMLMSILVTPFGVIAAVYLREYAKQGWLTRVVRIAVNNLAGVPSIVYGIFGLGFFVYFLGGSIDHLFFPEAAPAPVFGTPGLLWASLTLALLTVPVVIVATEEGLTRIPKSIREGSLALGATKAETLWRVVLPMSSPAIMTGLILAIARAAGEVAPLMLVGVVKLAPSLPVDFNAPFIHLERKFMHLGFHIYDVGFQSPNVEAARPLVYATSFLLVVVIAILNLSAVMIRNRLRERYKSLET